MATCGLDLKNTSWKISNRKCEQSVPVVADSRKTHLAYIDSLIRQR